LDCLPEKAPTSACARAAERRRCDAVLGLSLLPAYSVEKLCFRRRGGFGEIAAGSIVLLTAMKK
jgi:hypothetical protein